MVTLIKFCQTNNILKGPVLVLEQFLVLPRHLVLEDEVLTSVSVNSMPEPRNIQNCFFFTFISCHHATDEALAFVLPELFKWILHVISNAFKHVLFVAYISRLNWVNYPLFFSPKPFASPTWRVQIGETTVNAL